MNVVDMVLLIVVVLAIIGGFTRGFILGSIDLATWILGLLAAFWGYPFVAQFLEYMFPNLGFWIRPLSFFIALIIARIILGFIANQLLASTPQGVHTNLLNKLLGIVPGFINGVLYAAIISALLMSFPISDELAENTRQSQLAGRLALKVDWLEDKLSPVFDEAISKTMNKLTVEPESTSAYDLKFTVDNPKIREDLEEQMLILVNEERAKVGLPALEADPEIRVVARAHSRDMFAKGYFAHTNKENLTPAQRVMNAGIKFTIAGENLALGPTLKICHQGLMNSPGHRANILQKRYGRVGIGILEGGRHGLMVTQNFRN